MESGEIKVEKYWPDAKTTRRYGKLRCTCKEEHTYADYTIRLFRIELDDPIENGYANTDDLNNNDRLNNNYINGRDVVQYHFTNWIDHGVPEYSDSVALLVSSVHSHWSYRRPEGKSGESTVTETNLDEELFELQNKSDQLHPIVVHCSG